MGGKLFPPREALVVYELKFLIYRRRFVILIFLAVVIYCIVSLFLKCWCLNSRFDAGVGYHHLYSLNIIYYAEYDALV